jgi:hypothetical protein
LFLDQPVTTISSRFCQRERFSRGKFARDEFRADGQHEHQSPGEHDGGVEFEKPVLPEDDLVGTKAHDRPPSAGRWGVRPAGRVSRVTRKRAMTNPRRQASSRSQ